MHDSFNGLIMLVNSWLLGKGVVLLSNCPSETGRQGGVSRVGALVGAHNLTLRTTNNTPNMTIA